MGVYKKEFIATPGTYRIFNPTLYGVRILEVCREGIEHDATASTPTNRQFKYLVSSIYFDSLIPFVLGEKVFVLYEI